MGLFSRLFGKKKKESREEKDIFYVQQDDLMLQANQEARDNFKYFWRECYWEHRRIVKAHSFAMVKMPFTQDIGQAEPLIEHMWINNIQFDGETVKGELVNEPYELTNVKVGDKVNIDLNDIDDWMFAVNGKTYGGFTIHAIRKGMTIDERTNHDNAWGLDFGSFDDILYVYEQKEHPENLIDHPMAINMRESLEQFLKDYPNEMSLINEDGLTMLHKEAIAGNRSNIEVLLNENVNTSLQSKSGKTAADFAKSMGWDYLKDILR